MTEITIVTDNKWHKFKYRYEVPEKVLKEDFDWMDDDNADPDHYGNEGYDDNFIKYKDDWYHLSEFMILHDPIHFKGWQGSIGESYFSGKLIKINPEESDEYMIAYFYQ